MTSHVMCVYRDAAAAARLMVGAFTIFPSSGVVPANGQAVVTVECVAEQAGHISEVNYQFVSLSLYVCVCVCVFVCLCELFANVVAS